MLVLKTKSMKRYITKLKNTTLVQFLRHSLQLGMRIIPNPAGLTVVGISKKLPSSLQIKNSRKALEILVAISVPQKLPIFWFYL